MRGNKISRLKFSRKIAIAFMLEIFAKNRDRGLSKFVKTFLLFCLKKFDRTEMRIIRITSIIRICI